MAGLSLLALTPSAVSMADPKPACPTRIGVEASVAAAEGQDGVFRLRAEAKDLATGTLLPSPQVFFRKGEEATASGSLPAGGEIRYVVKVDGSNAVFQLEAKCKDEITTSQKVSLQLPK
ncbi:MAG TPA: hypothetical protein VHN15_00105 [Thermoanaerobaculia bacterium]|nr:hypothetical protein [Thermoanaerobaculia bacterium]